MLRLFVFRRWFSIFRSCWHCVLGAHLIFGFRWHCSGLCSTWNRWMNLNRGRKTVNLSLWTKFAQFSIYFGWRKIQTRDMKIHRLRCQWSKTKWRKNRTYIKLCQIFFYQTDLKIVKYDLSDYDQDAKEETLQTSNSVKSELRRIGAKVIAIPWMKKP